MTQAATDWRDMPNKRYEWLRRRRVKSGLSLREVARRLALSAPYISDIERGQRRVTKPIAEFYRSLKGAQ